MTYVLTAPTISATAQGTIDVAPWLYVANSFYRPIIGSVKGAVVRKAVRRNT